MYENLIMGGGEITAQGTFKADSGALEDPIPYNNNMELEEGKYYSQNEVTYLCTRSTGQAVYNNLSELVGIYVQTVESESFEL